MQAYTSVERFAAGYFSTVEFCPLESFTDKKLCKKLFREIMKHDDHPLRVMFETKRPTQRDNRCIRAPRVSTERFSEFFILYGK